ncbi:hypothetical protein [Rhodoplanes sp. Z2-YC6860]|uniref:hypothetical protein n=1 Tax=Rhodoplanes sp. Z2-YC6860 TaxID=674703 RepID=UPI0012EE8AA9|nr:hypothetical protein [Rhodoplanes sp. Z2-YC6860]
MTKVVPPGWKPHEVTSRVDGWIVDPANPTRIPAAVAQIIARANPLPHSVIMKIRARMLARQRKASGK